MALIICKECGNEVSDRASKCPKCGCPINNKEYKTMEKKRKTKYVSIFCISAVIILFLFASIISLDSSSTQETAGSTQETIQDKIQSETAKIEEKNNFIQSCETFTYKEIMRNPDNYSGKKVKFTGEVQQVSTGAFSSVALLVAVTKGDYGYYDDNIYCTYTYSDNESRIMEDDIITIYGICEGDYTYTSVLGAGITVPKIDIKYIQIEDLKSNISLEKYNQIQEGMTYEEVVSIVGEEGEVVSEVDIGYPEYATKLYSWSNDNGTMTITFQNNKVYSKMQYGLQ